MEDLEKKIEDAKAEIKVVGALDETRAANARREAAPLHDIKTTTREEEGAIDTEITRAAFRGKKKSSPSFLVQESVIDISWLAKENVKDAEIARTAFGVGRGVL
jgi:hypothetical protein